MMSIHIAAQERIDQTKRTLKHYLSSKHIDYMAYMGAVIECELLVEQYSQEHNKPMQLYHMKMKNIIVRKFERYCLDNGYNFK